jgi:hypothetical protein
MLPGVPVYIIGGLGGTPSCSSALPKLVAWLRVWEGLTSHIFVSGTLTCHMNQIWAKYNIQ